MKSTKTKEKIIMDFTKNQYHNIAKSLVTIAGVLHDWGKSNDFFQYKLKRNIKEKDPYRHEYISCKMIERCYSLYGDDWLDEIADGLNEIKFPPLDQNFFDTDHKLRCDLPIYIKILCIIILTHHKLPKAMYGGKGDSSNGQNYIKNFNDAWEYFFHDNIYKEEVDEKTKKSRTETNKKQKDCFTFSKGVKLSKEACELVRTHISTLKNYNFDLLLTSTNFHLFFYYVRMSFMLADYYVSSCKSASKNRSEKPKRLLWANREKNVAGMKSYYCQTVQEHCFEVAIKAQEICDILLGIATENMPSAENPSLIKESPEEHEWQNKVVNEINKLNGNSDSNRFFCINMASTGKGKTITNAKIINAANKSLRYTLAVGLRTLVLQTGDSYTKTPVNFSKNDVSICMGSDTYRELYELDNKEEDNLDGTDDLMHKQNENEIDYDSTLNDEEVEFLNVLFNEKKYKSFLYKPVLVCTIDYLTRITQIDKGGKHILPLLRLLSADLIIDEIDDFAIEDLKIIQRLVYLTGMCGRNFVMSSATIPPDLALGFYKAYCKGIQTYNEFFNTNINCISVLCDEFETKTSSDMNSIYNNFIANRINQLNNVLQKHRGRVIPIDNPTDVNFRETIAKEIYNFHDANHILVKDKKVSIGCVRIANISTCVEVTQNLLKLQEPNYTIKVLCYHSQYSQISRDAIEKYLTKVLNRKTKKYLKDPIIAKTIKEGEENVIFILVATPVEEVGRDHDFDWTIIEPSSVHSIVQMSGRVLRHRNIVPQSANIGVLQYNFSYCKITTNKAPHFTCPGVETNKDIKMKYYDINKIIPQTYINHINSEPLIDCNINNSYQTNFDNLVEAEHFQASKVNNFISKGAYNINGFINEYWYLFSSKLEFRKSKGKSEEFTILPNSNEQDTHEQFKFSNKDKVKPIPRYKELQYTNLWFPLNYANLIKQYSQRMGYSEDTTTCLFGTITVNNYDDSGNTQYYYNDNLGLYKKT
jgi:CRISPR-associated endonuclease/helicase Cas3